MSDVNKLNNNCLFDPDYFKYQVTIDPSFKIDNDAATPPGTFPWAMIQSFLHQAVRLSNWPSDVYLTYVQDVQAELSSIQQITQNGSNGPWTPEIQEMLACNWEPYGMMSVDVTSETITFGTQQIWGCMNSVAFNFGNTKLQMPPNTVTANAKITKIPIFAFTSSVSTTTTSPPHGDWGFGVSTDKNNLQNAAALLNKHLYITVDNIPYDLGFSTAMIDNKNSRVTVSYNNEAAQKLGAILKKTDKTNTFYLNWFDQ
ncbi:MAG: hypothetical protein LBI71_00090 [Enterobacteriaceae bacterium]|jgi:hypothetical protein|nr:hypothetical protein [Enterobacteriaceae bacterium]